MKNQIKFLISLGAYENSYLIKDKIGITSNTVSLLENDKLWLESNREIPLKLAVDKAIDELKKEVIDLAANGTITPKLNSDFTENFQRIIDDACDEIELDISFDGYSYEEAIEISKDKERFIKMLQNNELEYFYLAYDEDIRVCILTLEQIEKLAILSVELDVYRYLI